MVRKVGSGHANEQAKLIEKMLAFHIEGKSTEAGRLATHLQREVDEGRCGMDAEQVDQLLLKAARLMYPEPTAARRLEEGEGPGDVLVRAEPDEWIEVKAQTKKGWPSGEATASQLTEADWVREGCHALRYLRANDASFESCLDDQAKAMIGSASSTMRDWSFTECWLADIAALRSMRSLKDAGITTPDQLREWISRKQFFLLDRSGALFGPLSKIPAVAYALGGGTVNYRLKDNKGSLAAVQVFWQGTGNPGKVDFTYHVYSRHGRHKLHKSALPLAELSSVPTSPVG